jgi:hypothetical protein
VPWDLLADAVVLLHLAVVAFIVFGGLLALRWPRAALVHLPFAAWGVAIEIGQWTCPLTPLENRLRRLSGETGYEGGFIAHYLLPVLYPERLTANTGLALAALVLAVNVAIYAAVARQRHRRPTPPQGLRRSGAARYD